MDRIIQLVRSLLTEYGYKKLKADSILRLIMKVLKTAKVKTRSKTFKNLEINLFMKQITHGYSVNGSG